MKSKHIILSCLLVSIITIAGCGIIWLKAGHNSEIAGGISNSAEYEGNADFGSNEGDNSAADDEIAGYYNRDYTSDIKADVDAAADSASSLQEELTNIQNVTDKYKALFNKDSQSELNIGARWYYEIWNTELNSLLNRFSDSADAQTRKRVLDDQTKWEKMKEELMLKQLGPPEEGGTIYGLLVSSLDEEITKRRAYIIADKLAKLKGELFILPEKSTTKYGIFADDQGTGRVCSSLITDERLDGEDEAVISVYRSGEITGTFTDKGNGVLHFTGEDGSVKGTIRIDGWQGATFEVTESDGRVPFKVGDKFKFPIVF